MFPTTCSSNLPRTKIYLETDSSTYFVGQKIELKATLFDAQTNRLDSLNSTLFVELINSKNAILNKRILKINNSKASTSFQIPKNLASGYYQIRAYTHWMNIFAADAIPTKEILILGINFEAELSNKTSQKTEVLDFRPEGGKLVSGLINRGLVVVKDNYQNGIETDGFLVINQDTVANFRTDKFGQALVQFTPIAGQTHKILTPKTELDVTSQIVAEGVVIRGDWVESTNRLRVLIQNNLPAGQSPHLIGQIKGLIYQYSPVSKNETVVYFNQTDLNAGILNIGVISSDGKIFAERAFYIGDSKQDAQSKYLLFDSELDSNIEQSTDRDINIELIAKRNVVYGFDELLKERALPKMFDRGIVVSGKVKRPNGKTIKGSANISLSILPTELDTLNSKQFLIGVSDPTGYFTFENLLFYEEVECTVNATYKNESLEVEIESLTSPAITRTLRDVDWSKFEKKQINNATIARQDLIYRADTLDKGKTVDLSEVVVKAAKIMPNSSNILLKNPPSKRIYQDRLVGGSNVMQLFYDQNIAFRLQKYYLPKVIMLLDDNVIFSLDNINSEIIAYIDILDGTPEANMLGADIVVNIYTKYHTINPIVREYLVKNQISFPKKIKLNGYDYADASAVK
ncbi:MAG: hypothetical protein MUF45_11290 [Spirosomaceae bacterium]|nr:hypothetical protein [Spirosomataceae bacterium]